MSTGADALKKAMEEAAAERPEPAQGDNMPEGNPGATTARAKPRGNTKREPKTRPAAGNVAGAEEEERKVTVRLPVGLHRRIRMEAAASDRSMQAVIKDILDARIPAR